MFWCQIPFPTLKLHRAPILTEQENSLFCSLGFSQSLLMTLVLAGAELLPAISQEGRARLHIYGDRECSVF